MKKKYAIYLIIAFVIITGCDDYLEKYPLTSVSIETYFKTSGDFELYVNQFYDDLGDWMNVDLGIFEDDAGSDTEIQSTPDTKLNGQYVKPTSDGDWSDAYTNIRAINILLANTSDASWEEISGYVGEAKFFRAWYYYKLLRKFGGVPWINEVLDPTDTEGLTTPRSERNIIADSIVADLDFAIANLPDKSDAEEFRIYKEVALAFKSRVCLYEGTWEKYHGKEGDLFQVEGSDGSSFLEQAADAAQEVISSGVFSIAKDGEEPYYNLFNQEDYSNNKEIMLWRQQSSDLRAKQSRSKEISEQGGRGCGLTKELIDAYLCLDGNPISLTSLTVSDDSLPALIINRDPRLAQTLYTPGDIVKVDDDTGDTIDLFDYPDLARVRTGYHFRKGGSHKASNMQENTDETAFIYFRYAEVLLNYIEAKAELYESGEGTLSQTDFDITINELRDRVGMADFDFANSFLDEENPFTGSIPWYLVEIRRERKIELAIEGFRYDDIFRWAAADELIKGNIFRGAPFQWYIDRGWYASEDITFVDNEGYLSPWFNTDIYTQGGYNFDLTRDYLYPIPSQEELLGGYTNNPGWE